VQYLDVLSEKEKKLSTLNNADIFLFLYHSTAKTIFGGFSRLMFL
jgi:hypothetical protein